MDDIFSHLLGLTSYVSHQFIRFIEDLLFRDVGNCSDYFVDSSSSRHEHPLPSAYCIGKSVYDNCSSSSLSCNASRVLQIQESGTSYLEELLPVCSRFEIVLSNYYYRGVGFIFKGYFTLLIKVSLKAFLLLKSFVRNHNLQLKYLKCIMRSLLLFNLFLLFLIIIISPVLYYFNCLLSFLLFPIVLIHVAAGAYGCRLMLPISSLRFSWRLTFASLRSMFCYVRSAKAQVRSIISRVWKTLHGSSGEIGWLQEAPGMAPVKDGSARFLELLECIRNGEHKLPDSFVYLLIPGLFSNHGPLYFVSAKRYFSKMGLACHIAKIHSEASVEHNAWELKQYIEELYWGSGKRVMLLGHSKGGVDAAAALSIYWCDLKDKVGGLVLVQSPYGGTPLASDILREGQIADKETRRIMELLICKLIKGDIRALEDLTYEKRKEFIMKHNLPKSIPLISFHSEASAAPSVIATLTQIAHVELPWLPLPRFSCDESGDVIQAGRKVPVVVPISAVMAVCALHLQLRYGEKSDGLVICRDAEVPGSIVVRPNRKLDHAWMVYSSWKKNLKEPDACEMCEALLTQLVELGKAKQD